jgi:BatD DUF11 like domain
MINRARIGNMKMLCHTLWMVSLLFVGAFAVQLHAATVTATLDPAQISLGDSAQLTVTVTGSQEQPVAPTVDGLDIQSISQSTQIEFINGAMTANASNTYQITPQHAGNFTIPTIKVGGAASQPLALRVVAGSTAPAPTQAASAPTQNGPVVLPPQGYAQQPAPDGMSASMGRFGSIEVTFPKKEIYVGELIPVDVRVYVPEDTQASITDLPQMTSDGFTLNSLGTKPERGERMIGDRPYGVLTWHSALTGVKTGDFPFNLEMPMTVIVQQQVQQSGDPNDMFNNFFRNAFAQGTKKNITLHNSPVTLKILPLPEANRPADFSGAVGQFEIEASATPTKINVGDPLTLRLKISGTGNFDRVSSDMLAADSHWKTYSAKSQFQQADSVGYQGTKVFEQPVIPNDTGASTIPSLTFSYFNPETRQYVTRTAPPIAISVNGSPAASAPAPAIASTGAPQPTPPQLAPKPQPPADDLRPIKVESGSFVSTLRPIYLNPWFVAGQGLPLLALLGGLALIRRQRHAAHPQRLRATAAQQAIREQVAAMDSAVHNRQTDAFFIHARSALQYHLGQQWDMRPETITLADIETRLGTGGENIRPIFDMADQASYSDLHFEESDLAQWRQIVVNKLAEKNR